MKKYIVMCLALSLFILPMVSAGSYWMNTVDELSIVEKNPSDWSVVENGANGIVKFTVLSRRGRIIRERIRVTVYGLEPKTKYQLIYYGDETHNDVFPYATCIGKPRKTSTKGYFKSGSAKFSYLNMLDDGIAQKFWVVLASDVSCSEGKMIAWNPESYLFEENTI